MLNKGKGNGKGNGNGNGNGNVELLKIRNQKLTKISFLAIFISDTIYCNGIDIWIYIWINGY